MAETELLRDPAKRLLFDEVCLGAHEPRHYSLLVHSAIMIDKLGYEYVFVLAFH